MLTRTTRNLLARTQLFRRTFNLQQHWSYPCDAKLNSRNLFDITANVMPLIRVRKCLGRMATHDIQSVIKSLRRFDPENFKALLERVCLDPQTDAENMFQYFSRCVHKRFLLRKLWSKSIDPAKVIKNTLEERTGMNVQVISSPKYGVGLPGNLHHHQSHDFDAPIDRRSDDLIVELVLSKCDFESAIVLYNTPHHDPQNLSVVKPNTEMKYAWLRAGDMLIYRDAHLREYVGPNKDTFSYRSRARIEDGKIIIQS